MILEELTRRSASESEVATKLEFGADLPRQMARFAREMRDETFKKAPTQSGARAETFDMRQIDNRLRHGAPVIYREFAPTTSNWVPVTKDDRDIDGTVGVIMAPPPGVGGPAYIVLFVADEGMGDGLLEAAVKFGEAIRRIAAGFLAELGLGDPLAVLADFPDPRSA
jgi:hypothetical protein